ncbi:MAG: hypothetical protein PSN34_13335 [Urechidicola sp.]|nr:hypothetical protein [Urechidicola sp.]
MLSIGVIFFAIGFMLVIFNTIDFKFVKDQEKNKQQAMGGFVIGIIGLILSIWAIMGMMAE